MDDNVKAFLEGLVGGSSIDAIEVDVDRWMNTDTADETLACARLRAAQLLVDATPEPTRSMTRETVGPGVQRLLEHLAAMTGESVYLWHRLGGPGPEWRVWTGAPSGTSGGEWGAGDDAYAALADAFRRITSAIFDGRLLR